MSHGSNLKLTGSLIQNQSEEYLREGHQISRAHERQSSSVKAKAAPSGPNDLKSNANVVSLTLMQSNNQVNNE